MFAREEIIPAEDKLKGCLETCKNDWVIDRGRAWVETRYKVRKAMETAWEKRSKYWNSKWTDNQLEAEDKVRICKRYRERCKLKNSWSEEIWKVVIRI